MDLEYESWEPLFEIADMLPGVSHSQLMEWESKRARGNDFPEPKATQGRFKFYDPAEVKRWVHLHRKATKRMGRGAQINGKG